MQFCPKCGSLLKVKTEKGKKVLYCSCGYSTEEVEKAEIKEEVKKDDKDVEVVEEKHESLPITKATCPKCGYEEAYYWLVQTRAGDEAETRFFKCVKCGYQWRENE